jgi:large subunit ribosomal protein L24
MAQWIKKDDLVEVIAGDDRGAQGKVLQVLRDKNRLVVEGVNRVYKHLRKTQQNPRGGRLSKEMPIDVSNVLLVDPATGRGARTGSRILPDGSKERFFKKSGAGAGLISPPKAARATKKA